LSRLVTVNRGMIIYGQQAVQAAARQGAGMCSLAQQFSAFCAAQAAASETSSDPIVKQAGVILAPDGVTGIILTVRDSVQIPNFMGAFVPGLPGSFSVSAQATFWQEGCRGWILDWGRLGRVGGYRGTSGRSQ
jgi:hypothetical protein